MNVCIGYDCGPNITTGDGNVCIGSWPAQLLTTGSNNLKNSKKIPYQDAVVAAKPGPNDMLQVPHAIDIPVHLNIIARIININPKNYKKNITYILQYVIKQKISHSI
tara:strand:- start:585 stop:905 length:321 start_codon:yes stop_codon:yes gene_type:complete